MNTYDHISFDLDGVLLDSEKYGPDGWIRRAFDKVLSELEVKNNKENFERLFSDSLKEDIEGICRKFGLSGPKKLWSVREKHLIREKLEALTSGEIRPFKDVEAIPKLSKQYSLSIVSNSPQSVADKFVEIAEIEPFFNTVIGRGSTLEDFMKTKPDPHLLKKMMKDVGPKEAIYVGDRETDFLAANSLGLDFFWMRRNERDPGEESSISNLYELDKALKTK